MQSLIPLNALGGVHSVFRSLVDDTRLTSRGSAAARLLLGGPRVDLIEDETTFTLRAEVPGIRREDLEVTLNDDVLTLAGTMQDVEAAGTEVRLLGERRFESFRREFRLPIPVDAEGVRAEQVDGVLTVHLPKAESAKPRMIEVHGS